MTTQLTSKLSTSPSASLRSSSAANCAQAKSTSCRTSAKQQLDTPPSTSSFMSTFCTYSLSRVSESVQKLCCTSAGTKGSGEKNSTALMKAIQPDSSCTHEPSSRRCALYWQQKSRIWLASCLKSAVSSLVTAAISCVRMKCRYSTSYWSTHESERRRHRSST